MADIIQMRGDIESNWQSVNPILVQRELAFTLDTTPIKMKIGNGVTPWNGLTYFAGLNGSNGDNGIGIVSASIDLSGHLLITLTDSTIIDVGLVKGANGTNGVSITGANIDGSGHLILTFSDSSTIDAGVAKGADGTGIGDMLKTVYDTNDDGIVNHATDLAIGNRTLTDATLLSSYSGNLTTLLTGIISLQKLVTGKSDARTAPAKSLESLNNQQWIQQFILANPTTAGQIITIPLCRNGTMATTDFYCIGTPSTATTITVKQGVTTVGTISISASGKSTLTYSATVTGTSDDLFTYTVSGDGLSTCQILCNQKWVNR